MKTRIKILSRKFKTDGKTTTCNIEACLHVNSLLSKFRKVNLYGILVNDKRWNDFVEKNSDKFDCPGLGNIYFSVSSKAVCHDDDGFDKKCGEHLAEDRAMMKVFNRTNMIIKKIMSIFIRNSESLRQIRDFNMDIMKKMQTSIKEKENNYDNF